MKKIPLDPEHRARQKKIRKMLAAGLPLAALMSGLSGCSSESDQYEVRGKMTACEESGEAESPEVRIGIAGEPFFPEPPNVHVVRKGDTLASIAGRYGTTAEDLKELNGLTGKQAALIRPGQEIKLK